MASDGGKGDKRRPYSPGNKEQFESNWDLIFGKKQSRIDTIGQNGNDGIHYDSDDHSGSSSVGIPHDGSHFDTWRTDKDPKNNGGNN